MEAKAWRNRSRNIPNSFFSSDSANNSNAYDPAKTWFSKSQAMPVLNWANRWLKTPAIYFSHIISEGVISGISILLPILSVWFSQDHIAVRFVQGHRRGWKPIITAYNTNAWRHCLLPTLGASKTICRSTWPLNVVHYKIQGFRFKHRWQQLNWNVQRKMCQDTLRGSFLKETVIMRRRRVLGVYLVYQQSWLCKLSTVERV